MFCPELCAHQRYLTSFSLSLFIFCSDNVDLTVFMKHLHSLLGCLSLPHTSRFDLFGAWLIFLTQSLIIHMLLPYRRIFHQLEIFSYWWLRCILLTSTSVFRWIFSSLVFVISPQTSSWFTPHPCSILHSFPTTRKFLPILFQAIFLPMA